MKQKDRIEIFRSYSIPKAFIALAIPTIISQLIAIIYNYADAWFVGRTNNPNAVAALSVVMPIYIILAGLANLFGVGGTSLIARFLGQGKEDKAKHTFAFSLWGSVVLAAVYSFVMYFFAAPIIHLAGGTDSTFDFIYKYIFYTTILGGIPMVLNNVFGHLLRSVGASKEASFGMSMGVILNIILDPIFMFVILPAGNEVTGAAVATAISNVFASLFFIFYILRHREIKVLTLNPKDISFKDNIPLDVLTIGFPACLGTILAMVSNIFANKLMSSYSSAAIAGIGTAKRANTLGFNICMGITQGMLPFIAFNYAAKQTKRMFAGIKFMLTVALSFSLIVMVLYMVFPSTFIKFFIKDADTVAYGKVFLEIIAVAVPLCALSFSMTTIFQAAGKRIYSFILSILRKGLLDIPLMFLLKYLMTPTGHSEYGIVIATPIAEVLSVIIAFVMFFNFKKHLNTVDLEQA